MIHQCKCISCDKDTTLEGDAACGCLWTFLDLPLSFSEALKLLLGTSLVVQRLTPLPQCREPEFHPRSGNKNPHAATKSWRSQTTENLKTTLKYLSKKDLPRWS